MYLHRLGFGAIGPFPGEHVIDLGQVGASGLFLLDGPTGAGKSTVIDAIVFALYGKVASSAASDDRLRSAHAAPDTESYVDLVFETPAGIFRIRRTPAYARPKRRGAGTTMQKASVKLWRLAQVPPADQVADAVGELRSNRPDEVGVELRRIIGLDRDQFVQTVVLPQGEFAEFLRAKPEDRAVLLQRVFATEVYDRLSSRLTELSRNAARRVEVAEQNVRAAVEQFIGAAGVDHLRAEALRNPAAVSAAQPAAPARSGDSADLAGPECLGPVVPGASPADPGGSFGLDRAGRVAVEVAALDATAAELGARADGARHALDVARAAVDDGRAMAALIQRRNDLRSEEVALAADSARIAEVRKRRDAGDRAAVVWPALQGSRAATAAKDAAAGRLEAARLELPAAVREDEMPVLATLRDEVGAALTRGLRLLEVGNQIPVREQLIADRRKELDRIQEERTRLIADLVDRPTMRAELVDDQRATDRAVTAEPGLVAAVDRCREIHTAAAAAAAAVVGLRAASTELATRQQVATAAVAHESALRTAHIAGLAGELAAALIPGEPCPVCGSDLHPHPAAVDAAAVDGAEVEAAEQLRVVAGEQAATAASRVAAIKERIALTRAAAGGVEPAEAAQALARAQDELAANRALAARATAAVQAVGDFDQATAVLSDREVAIGAEIVAAAAELTQLTEALAADRAEIAAELASITPLLGTTPVSMAAGHDLLTAYARHLDGVLTAAAEFATARSAAADRVAEVAELANRQGFTSAEEAADAVVDPVELALIDEEVVAYDSACVRLRVALADSEFVALTEDAAVDLAALTEAESVAAQAARTAAESHSVAVRAAQSARAAQAEVVAATEAWTTARTEAGPMARLATLASGTGADNTKAMSLTTFVLIRRFEDVVAAANDRLREMSSGRYELKRSESKEDVRSRRVGLAMRVVDHVTEQERDPRTLSGGETFYVSLCLALGLADVVTAEAGGVELGTLFVDEGFGSLDAETLDVVLAELGRLRAAGRVVGVVSHVEAMRQSIAEQVRVRPLPGGGSTLDVRG